MGMSYDELSHYGRLRIPGRCGPYSMFCKLLHEWGDKQPPSVVRRVLAEAVGQGKWSQIQFSDWRQGEALLPLLCAE